MGIRIEPYDESWPSQFEVLKRNYEEALVGVPVLSIEHVGSTSVPGLWAKPIIDIDIVVAGEHYQEVISALTNYGYKSRGDLGIEGRWAFEAVNAPYRTNTYVVHAESLAFKNHLALREVLRSNPGLRDEYSLVKQNLANETSDIDIYVSGKTDVLRRVLKLGGLDDEELGEIASVNSQG
ncbi:MAG: GrpB family protein [Actinomycetota bacterium]